MRSPERAPPRAQPLRALSRELQFPHPPPGAAGTFPPTPAPLRRAPRGRAALGCADTSAPAHAEERLGARRKPRAQPRALQPRGSPLPHPASRRRAGWGEGAAALGTREGTSCCPAPSFPNARAPAAGEVGAAPARRAPQRGPNLLPPFAEQGLGPARPHPRTQRRRRDKGPGRWRTAPSEPPPRHRPSAGSAPVPAPVGIGGGRSRASPAPRRAKGGEVKPCGGGRRPRRGFCRRVIGN